MKKNLGKIPYTQLTFFKQADFKSDEAGDKNNNCKEQKIPDITDICIDGNNFYIGEIEYTEKEKAEVIKQLQSALWLHRLENKTTKRKLKSWFADVAMQHFGEYCPNVTGKDLCEIAKEIGIEVIE